jgi:hypothetical protein
MNEVKWIIIFGCTLFTGMFMGLAFDSYMTTQCKVAGIAQRMSAEDISKLCKGK